MTPIDRFPETTPFAMIRHEAKMRRERWHRTRDRLTFATWIVSAATLGFAAGFAVGFW